MSLIHTHPSSSETISETIRSLIDNLFTPFKRDYRQWPWGYIGTIVVVCIGSYTFYRYIPGPYRRYYMSSTRNFSRRYNQALDIEKKKLFTELMNLQTREHGKRLHVVEIGAAHGANMSYYPQNLVDLTVVEPIRDFEVFLTQTLRQNTHVKCLELLIGGAENMSIIRDNHIDAVVSTLTLTSCKDVHQALREIRRILKPGGIFIYLENIRSPNLFFAFLQYLCAPIYKFLFGISLIRNIPEYVERAHFPGGTTQQIFYAHGIPLLLRPHVAGIARK